MSVSEKQVLLEYPDESTGPLNVNIGCGLCGFVKACRRGELREEREEELPMPSLEGRRLSCANMSRQAESPVSGV